MSDSVDTTVDTTSSRERIKRACQLKQCIYILKSHIHMG